MKTYVLLTDERVQCIFFLEPEDKWDLVFLEMKNDKLYYNWYIRLLDGWLFKKGRRRRRERVILGKRKKENTDLKKMKLNFILDELFYYIFFIVTPAILHLNFNNWKQVSEKFISSNNVNKLWKNEISEEQWTQIMLSVMVDESMQNPFFQILHRKLLCANIVIMHELLEKRLGFRKLVFLYVQMLYPVFSS